MARGKGWEFAWKTTYELAQAQTVFRAKDLAAKGASRAWIDDVVGVYSGMGRAEPGVFVDNNRIVPAEVRASAKWPHAAVWGPSALAVHELCPPPPEVWLAIDHKARAPKTDFPLRIVRVRNLGQDPDVRTILRCRLFTRTFTAERAMVDCMLALGTVPFDLAEIALEKLFTRKLERNLMPSDLEPIAVRRHGLPRFHAALEALWGMPFAV